MKRILVLTVMMAVLIIPSMLFAADKVAVGDIEVANGTVTIPVVVSNVDGLMAMDLPLKFSEGVILILYCFEESKGIGVSNSISYTIGTSQ